MLRALWRGWLVVAKKIGQLQSFLILTLVYFVVIAPFAVATRLLGDPLGLLAGPAWRAPERRPGGATTPLGVARQQF